MFVRIVSIACLTLSFLCYAFASLTRCRFEQAYEPRNWWMELVDLCHKFACVCFMVNAHLPLILLNRLFLTSLLA